MKMLLWQNGAKKHPGESAAEHDQKYDQADARRIHQAPTISSELQ